jgi:tRNA (guanine-N7-)-methyltransferase
MARVRHHVNPLKGAFYGTRPAPVAGDGLEVEIGCADAQFLFERAAADPSRRYVGLEIRDELVAQVNRQAQATGAPVTAVFAHANLHLEDLFAPGAVARFYVNFPDPWFKRRHHKRRVVDAALARAMASRLGAGGELLFQSDIWDVALDAMAALEAEPGLSNRAGAWSFWRGGNPYGARSRREAWCEERGLPIWRIAYSRRA